MHFHSMGFLEQFASLGIVAMVIIAIVSGMKQAQRRKELEHFERIKAMELGLAPQPTGLDWPAAAVCIAIGAGVPIGSFVVAWLATLTADAPDGIWVAPVFVSFAAIGASRKLAYRIIDPRSGVKRPAQVKSAPNGKPQFDPDAFDVVSSRG
jgi:hypothetical protein